MKITPRLSQILQIWIGIGVTLGLCSNLSMADSFFERTFKSIQNSRHFQIDVRSGMNRRVSGFSKPTPNLNYVGGVNIHYYLGPSFGFFAGVEQIKHSFQLNQGLYTPLFLDVPIGVSFRQSRFLGQERSSANLKLGGYCSVPLSQPKEISTLKYAQGSCGLGFEGSILYNLTPKLIFGPTVGLKHSLSSPLTDDTNAQLANPINQYVDLTVGASFSHIM
jgi:hypothetical protein